MRPGTKFYREHEREIMERFGFTPSPNSGAGWMWKDDGRNDKTVVELKSTAARSITIKRDDWDKLVDHSLVEGKRPLLVTDWWKTDDVLFTMRPEDMLTICRSIYPEEFTVPPPDQVPYMSVQDVKVKPKRRIKSNPLAEAKIQKEREEKWKR